MKINITLAAAVLLCVQAAAQNLDPTVNVTRAYEGKLLEVDKPSLRMAIPDSVTRFNLDFDYSVLKSPYRVGDDFSPYLQDIRPEASASDAKRLYFRVGAGYALHPELDLVWAAFNRESFRMNVYASHRSYYGNYGYPKSAVSKGYDIYTRAGVNGRCDYQAGTAVFDAAYVGIAAADSTCALTGQIFGGSYNGMDVSARARSNNNDASYFYYDTALRYRFGQQDFRLLSAGTSNEYVREHAVTVAATLGPVLSWYHAILVDMGVDVAAYSGTCPGLSHAGRLFITPKYRFTRDRWNVAAGVKAEFLVHPKDSPMNATRGQVVYPDVNINYAAVQDYMNVYFRAGGGADINSWSSMLGRNHFFSPAYMVGDVFLDNTVERVDVRVGIDGNIARVFNYDLRVGYADFKNCLVEQVVMFDGVRVPVMTSGQSMDQNFDLQAAYAALDFGVATERIDVNGGISWRHSFYGRRCPEVARAGFLPSPLTGDIRVVYNWKRRIFAGVSLEGMLGRKGKMVTETALTGSSLEDVTIPGYADLGVEFEYKFSDKFGLWARGGNLACMAIHRNPFHVEYGPWASVGISLNL